MILLVTGGRDFCESHTAAGEPRDGFMDERRALGFVLDYINPASVIVGDASGADRWAKIWCGRRSVPFREFKADWSNGARGGPERNQRMVDMKPDAAVRFPGGRGTQDCAHRCAKADVPVYQVEIK